MANGYNKVILMGNLTRDPEMRYTPSGTPVTEFGLAVNRRYTTKDAQQKEEVAFVDITAWGRQAEVIHQYMKKGRRLFLEGRLVYDAWTSKDGQKRSKLRVRLDSFQFMDGPRDGDAPQESPSPPDAAPQTPVDDDDIPF